MIKFKRAPSDFANFQSKIEIMKKVETLIKKMKNCEEKNKNKKGGDLCW